MSPLPEPNMHYQLSDEQGMILDSLKAFLEHGNLPP